MTNKDALFKNIFLVAALYDFILGIVFLLFYVPIYNYFSIPIPNYPMYLQLSAAFVIAMGVGYYFVYRNLQRNIDLVKLGIVYKAVYAALAMYFYFAGAAHFLFLLFAIFDIIFALLFIWFLSYSRAGV